MGLTSSFGKFPVMPVPVFPVGVPFPWVSTSPYPDGTLLCNGSSFSTVTYPELAVVFPTGILPDLRGVALRGRDNGKGLDVDGASRAVGSYQADELKSHKHVSATQSQNVSSLFGKTSTSYGSELTYSSSTPGMADYTSSTGGTETRMKNVAVDWLVYAETIAYDLTLNQGNALTLGGYSASYFAPLANIPSLIKSNLNVSGDAPMGVCRAWVNFDGTTTTPTILGSLNITSVTDEGVGQYLVTMSTPMPDTNYSVVVGHNYGTTATAHASNQTSVRGFPVTTSTFRITGYATGSATYLDLKVAEAVVFR